MLQDYQVSFAVKGKTEGCIQARKVLAQRDVSTTQAGSGVQEVLHDDEASRRPTYLHFGLMEEGGDLVFAPCFLLWFRARLFPHSGLMISTKRSAQRILGLLLLRGHVRELLLINLSNAKRLR